MIKYIYLFLIFLIYNNYFNKLIIFINYKNIK